MSAAPVARAALAATRLLERTAAVAMVVGLVWPAAVVSVVMVALVRVAMLMAQLAA